MILIRLQYILVCSPAHLKQSGFQLHLGTLVGLLVLSTTCGQLVTQASISFRSTLRNRKVQRTSYGTSIVYNYAHALRLWHVRTAIMARAVTCLNVHIEHAPGRFKTTHKLESILMQPKPLGCLSSFDTSNKVSSLLLSYV